VQIIFSKNARQKLGAADVAAKTFVRGALFRKKHFGASGFAVETMYFFRLVYRFLSAI
jgi:hypothetical protein